MENIDKLLQEKVLLGNYREAKEMATTLERNLTEKELLKILTSMSGRLEIYEFSEIYNTLSMELKQKKLIRMLTNPHNFHRKIEISEIFNFKLNQDIYESIAMLSIKEASGSFSIEGVKRVFNGLFELSEKIYLLTLEKSLRSGLERSFENSLITAKYLNRELTKKELKTIFKSCIKNGTFNDAEKAAKALGRNFTNVDLDRILRKAISLGNFTKALSITNISYYNKNLSKENLKTMLDICISKGDFDEAKAIKEFQEKSFTNKELISIINNPDFSEIHNDTSLTYNMKEVLELLSEKEKIKRLKYFLKNSMKEKRHMVAKDIAWLLPKHDFNKWFNSLGTELMFDLYTKEKNDSMRSEMNKLIRESGVDIDMYRLCTREDILEHLASYNLVLKQNESGRKFLENIITKKRSPTFKSFDRVLEEGYFIVRDYRPEEQAILSLEKLTISDYWAPTYGKVHFIKVRKGIYRIESMRTFPLSEIGQPYCTIIRLDDFKRISSYYEIKPFMDNYLLLREEYAPCCRGCGVNYTYTLFEVNTFKISNVHFNSKEDINKENIKSYFETKEKV